MSHDRGCFRCFEDRPYDKCQRADCPMRERRKPPEIVRDPKTGAEAIWREIKPSEDALRFWRDGTMMLCKHGLPVSWGITVDETIPYRLNITVKACSQCHDDGTVTKLVQELEARVKQQLARLPATVERHTGDSGAAQEELEGTANDRCAGGRHGPHPLKGGA